MVEAGSTTLTRRLCGLSSLASTSPRPNFPAEDKSHNLLVDVVDPIHRLSSKLDVQGCTWEREGGYLSSLESLLTPLKDTQELCNQGSSYITPLTPPQSRQHGHNTRLLAHVACVCHARYYPGHKVVTQDST